MVLTNSYITINNLKDALQQKKELIDNDTWLETCCNLASRNVDDETGSYFYKKTCTSEYVGWLFSKSKHYIDEVGFVLYLGAPYISGIIIVEDGVTLVNNIDYRIMDKQIIRLGRQWSKRITSANSGVFISGVFGYEVDDEEYQIAKLCTLEIAKVLSGLESKLTMNEGGSTSMEPVNYIPKWIVNKLQSLGRNVF